MNKHVEKETSYAFEMFLGKVFLCFGCVLCRFVLLPLQRQHSRVMKILLNFSLMFSIVERFKTQDFVRFGQIPYSMKFLLQI